MTGLDHHHGSPCQGSWRGGCTWRSRLAILAEVSVVTIVSVHKGCSSAVTAPTPAPMSSTLRKLRVPCVHPLSAQGTRAGIYAAFFSSARALNTSIVAAAAKGAHVRGRYTRLDGAPSASRKRALSCAVDIKCSGYVLRMPLTSKSE